MTQDECLNRFSKVRKVETICISEDYSDDKVNLMLQNGWKIFDTYKRAYETDNLLAGGSMLYCIFAHEDPNAQVPLTEREIRAKRDQENQFREATEMASALSKR